MATVAQAGSPSYPPPPSYSQESTRSSMNGLQRSHSTMTSFEAPQSSATTPTPTPPTSRQQQPLQYSFLGNSQKSYPASRSFQDGHPQQYPPHKPQIYTAIYSGVSVYEMEVDGLAVMKRRSDSWMNATQILKLAGVDKGKRTKVLEKEILAGEHEKVQGGYGKYQGTWISYERAIAFAKGYGVLEPLRPLLDYDMGLDGAASGGTLITPTKEQAMAAQRKRNMMNGGMDRPPAQSPNGTFFKNISKSAANAVNAINKARFDSPAPRPASGGRHVPQMRRSSQQMMESQEYPGSSQQSMQSLHSEHSFRNSQVDPALQSMDAQDIIMNGDEPPRKRMKSSFTQETQDTQMGDADSFLAPPQGSLEYLTVGLNPLRQPSGSSAIEKQQLLSSLFYDSSMSDFSTHPAMTRLVGEDFDIPIDNTAHTALHWAATLARTKLARYLIKKGASIYRLNTGGETALIRAAMTTNNLDQGSFPDLLELLGPTIEIRDGRGRTVLHHIAVSSAVKGPKRSSACRYYLEALLEYVVRSGSATSSQANSFQDPSITTTPRTIGLARFMSEIVNSTDLNGDTALNIAARVGNKSIIQQLLEVGANPTIPNRGGLRPMDFGVAGDTSAVNVDGETSNQQLIKASDAPQSRVSETGQELITSLKTLINDTETSFNAQMREKQSLIDQTHLRLRETAASLADERRRLDSLKQKAEQRQHLKSRIANLRQSNERAKISLINSGGGGDGAEAKVDVQVGEADAGLEIDVSILPLSLTLAQDTREQGATAAITALNDRQKQYAAALPSPMVLRTRTEAYKRINERLEHEKMALGAQSQELEGTLRRVLALCTGVGEEKVGESVVGGLVKAVRSEEGGLGGEREVARVREFLRRVEEV